MKVKKDTATLWTDRERVLLNIAAVLASELSSLQLEPAVQRLYEEPRSLRKIRAKNMSFHMEDLKKGDLVVCSTSTHLRPNPYNVAFVEQVGIKDDPNGAVLRAVGSDRLCNYGNESFIKITGIPAFMIRDGEQQVYAVKLSKAIRMIRKIPELDSFKHVYRGLSFEESPTGSKLAVIHVVPRYNYQGEKPYDIRLSWREKMPIKEIKTQLLAAGFGSREFECGEKPAPPAGNQTHVRILL